MVEFRDAKVIKGKYEGLTGVAVVIPGEQEICFYPESNELPSILYFNEDEIKFYEYEDKNEVWSPVIFADKMRKLAKETQIGNGYDLEEPHILMDELMCDLLRKLGYEEGVKIFLNTPKWYS